MESGPYFCLCFLCLCLASSLSALRFCFLFISSVSVATTAFAGMLTIDFASVLGGVDTDSNSILLLSSCSALYTRHTGQAQIMNRCGLKTYGDGAGSSAVCNGLIVDVAGCRLASTSTDSPSSSVLRSLRMILTSSARVWLTARLVSACKTSLQCFPQTLACPRRPTSKSSTAFRCRPIATNRED